MSSSIMLYGRPEMIINSVLEKIQKEPSPRNNKLETLIEFAIYVENLVPVMLASNLINHLWNLYHPYFKNSLMNYLRR